MCVVDSLVTLPDGESDVGAADAVLVTNASSVLASVQSSGQQTSVPLSMAVVLGLPQSPPPHSLSSHTDEDASGDEMKRKRDSDSEETSKAKRLKPQKESDSKSS